MKKNKKGLENKMNKMKKRLIILTLVLVMTGGIITGCSTGSITTKDMQKTENSTISSEKVTLRILSWSADKKPVYEALIDKYEKANSNVDIILEVCDAPATLYTSVTVGIQSGDAPDLFTSHGSKTTNLEGLVRSGSVLPLDGKLNLDGYPQIAIDCATVDGKLYMSPAAVQDCFFIWYNKVVFKNAGVDLPKTHEELLVACEKIKSIGVTPIIVPAKDIWGPCMIENAMPPVFDIAWNDAFVKGKAKLTDSGFRKTLEMFDEMNKKGYFGNNFQSMDSSTAIMDFLGDKAGMFINGQWHSQTFLPEKEKIGIFYWPSSDGKVRVSGGIDTNTGFSIWSKTKYPEEAIKFLNFLASRESTQMYCDMINSVPLQEGVVSKDEWSNYLATGFDEMSPLWLDALATMAKEGTDPMTHHLALLQSMMNGTETVDDVIAKTELVIDYSQITN